MMLQAVDIGGYLYMNSHIDESMAECFPEKLRWWLKELSAGELNIKHLEHSREQSWCVLNISTLLDIRMSNLLP